MNYLAVCLSKMLLKLRPKAFLKDLLVRANKVIEEAENSQDPEEIIISLMNPYSIVFASLEAMEEDTPRNIKLLNQVHKEWERENDE